MKELEYPFSAELLLKKKRKYRRLLLEDETMGKLLEKKIAILGGSTTTDIKEILELFLLNSGIQPRFYESDYEKYWEDAVFDNPQLAEFAPDIIYIHTSNRNIGEFPEMADSDEKVQERLERVFGHFKILWANIETRYGCPIIQNNFDLPFYRLFGNLDSYNRRGRVWFVNQLNQMFAEYAEKKEGFYINDIHYLSASYGLSKWADPYYWYMYKYCLAVPAIPELAYNLSNIIKAIYGLSRKALVLDLDDTLWGGTVGDDGSEGIEIGQETPRAQIFSEFQSYVKSHKDRGILLAIDSKNEMESALAGLSRVESVLRQSDFLSIKANWEPKSVNLDEIAKELNIGRDAIVFVDNSPAERKIVKWQMPEIAVPEMEAPEHYIQVLDRAGYYETVSLSKEDVDRNVMYQGNAERERQLQFFKDYGDYLVSLQMHAEIHSFQKEYYARISQLTNKSNQFNLTTKRCSLSDIERYALESDYITLYGRLGDCFGDNGIVSVIFGCRDEKDKETFSIELWLMSCRVLKRGMEDAMMDELHRRCALAGYRRIKGTYCPTAKNRMVKDFYGSMGFSQIAADDKGQTVWVLDIRKDYQNKNKYIEVENK